MPSIAQGFGQVGLGMPWWVLGQFTERAGHDEKRDGINAYPQAVEITTVTVADPGDSIDVLIVINGVTVTTNTATGLDAAGVATAIAEAINAEPLVRGQVVASASTTTLTLTGLQAGVAFSVVATGPGLSAVTETQAAASAAVIEFGRAVCRIGQQNTDELVAKAQTALFVAQVFTGSLTFINGAVVRGQLYEVVGTERRLVAQSAPVTSATDVATVTTALVAAMNLAAPPSTVLFSGTSTIIGTSEVLGREWAFQFVYESGGSQPVFTVANTVGPNVTTSFHRSFGGIAHRDQAVGATTVGGVEAQYPPNSCVTYVKHGTVAVESAQAIVAGDEVYVELAVGADSGKFFNTASATRVAVSRSVAQWVLDADANTGSLAALRVTL
jgi:hypothetical protein